MRRAVTIAGWSCVWIVVFWAFLLIGFPAETARAWLAERLGRDFAASVTIEKLELGWNLDVRFIGVSVAAEGTRVRLDSFTLKPRLAALVLGRPEASFTGGTSSGGRLSGSYRAGEVTLAFADVSFSEFSIATVPLPATARVSGAGRLKIVPTGGIIDTEIDGVPGGKQRLKVPAGQAPGVNGRMQITVALPRV